jgi:hypothetical protein
MIYIPGGRGENEQIYDQLLVLDLEERVWGEAAALPVPLSAYALTTYEGNIYLFGGWDGRDYVNSVFRYDPTLDIWEILTPMPTARGFAGAAVSSEKIFVIGGFDGENALAVNEEYSPDKDVSNGDPWAASHPLPEGRYRFAIVSVAEIIHLLGGSDGSDSSPIAYKFSALKEEWQGFRVPVDETWTDFEATTYDNRIFTFGGQVNALITDRNYSYQAVFTTMIPVLP